SARADGLPLIAVSFNNNNNSQTTPAPADERSLVIESIRELSVMLRLEVSWDRRKQSGQVDFNAGFTAPPAHLAILCLASAVSGLAAALLAGRRLLWAVELTILSDVGNMLALSALLPILTKKVKESKLSVTSTAESYKVSLVAPEFCRQRRWGRLKRKTLGRLWRAAEEMRFNLLLFIYFIILMMWKY
ncbi:unnamed protein product, partial [Linum tenue]